MRFSDRTDWDLGDHELAAAVRERRAGGGELVDLTVANPTVCGFEYDSERLLAPLGDPLAMIFEPEPLGILRAREAVVRYYRDGGAEIRAERVCLTTSTSEGYSFLFRLLCGAGDEVLVARPSYPLFEFLARLDDVVLREYPLRYDPNADAMHGWSIDMDALEAAISVRTRAVILVHPNNPTGNFASETERVALEELCARNGLVLIVDEVFLDYTVGEGKARSFAAGKVECLTFVLSGISKVCGLPQMKVSWIVVSGPERMAGDAMARLEVIADTFLSMNAPMQFALPVWLEGRRKLQEQIVGRMRANLAALDTRLLGSLGQRLVVEGGWTAVLRVPRTVDGVGFAEAALERGVLVQPGEFYGLSAGRAVVSLLTPPEVWAEGLRRLPVWGDL